MKHRIFNISLFVIYITGITAVMIWQGVGIAPDRYVFVLLLVSLLVKRTRSFILDWIPFLFILISYDFLRGLAGNLAPGAHFVELIYADKALFGELPSLFLQQMFFNPSHLQWYDFLATIFYFLHFALPLGFGFLLWVKNRSFFRQFVVGILLLSYAGWISFVIYPAAPPWMAEQKGYINGITKILDLTLNFFPEKISLPTIYHQFNPNPVAAFPSMHAAYPMIVFLFAFSFFKLKALWFLPYVLGVWISMVYLGEHYVIDIIGGAIYATIFYLISIHIIYKINWASLFKKIIPRN